MVALATWKRVGILVLLCPALLACVSEPLESGNGPEAGEESTETSTSEGVELPTLDEQIKAVARFCTRLSTFCEDFSVGLCAEVQVSLLPEEDHPCHASVVRRTMCLASLARDQLECTSDFSGAPKPGFCEEERANASACYEQL